MSTMRILVCWMALTAVIAGPARAQTPPSAAEVAGYTGLLAAAARGDAAAVKALLRSDADLDVRDSHGRTAVHLAGYGSHLGVLRELVKAGAEIAAKDSLEYDVVTIAAVKNDVPLLKLALELGGNARAITSPYDGTALIAAAHLGHADVVRILIAAKAPLNHVNNLGWTAVIEAIVLGDGGKDHQATLKALIDAGADLSIGDRDGTLPIDLARRRGFAAMVAMLDAAGKR